MEESMRTTMELQRNKMLKDKNGHAKVIEEAELYVRAKLKLEILKP